MRINRYLRKAMSGTAFLLLGLGMVLVLMPGSVGAQEEYVLEDTVVTATKTGETLIQSTPIAISVFDDEAIQNVTAFDMADLSAFVPSLEFSRGGGAFIRGVGSTGAGHATEHSIGFYIDGAYLFQGRGNYVDFMDVERIEVVRGPQGTTYGRNSTGGLVNIITKKPSNELELEAGLEVGNYAHRKVNAVISGPLIKDKLLGRFSAYDVQHDPYFDNTSGRGLGDQNEHQFRGSLQVLPTENIDIILRGDWRYTNSAATGASKILRYDGPHGQWAADLGITEDEFLPSDFHTVAHNVSSFRREEIWGVSLEANIDFAHDIHLKSLTSYRYFKAGGFSERDNSLVPWGPVDTSDPEWVDWWQQDLVLNGATGPFQWLVGGVYYEMIQERPPQAIWIGETMAVNPEWSLDTTSWALFGELKYAITDNLGVTGGLRYTTEDKWESFRLEVLAGGSQAKHYPGAYYDLFVVARPPYPEAEGTYTKWTPKIGLDYQATEDIFLYGYYAEGFKSGTVSPGNWPAVDVFLDPELVTTYEMGIKSDWFDKRLRVNGAIFLNEYEDYQIRAFLPGSTSVVGWVNAGSADINGVEIEAVARPTQSLTVNGGVTYLDAEYTDFPLANQPNAAGNPVQSVPEWSATFGASYVVPIEGCGFLTFGANVGWRDDVPQGNYGNTDPLLWTEARALVNVRVRFETEDEHWTLELFGKNIFDKEYFDTKIMEDDLYGSLGDPMTMGVRLDFRY